MVENVRDPLHRRLNLVVAGVGAGAGVTAWLVVAVDWWLALAGLMVGIASAVFGWRSLSRNGGQGRVAVASFLLPALLIATVVTAARNFLRHHYASARCRQDFAVACLELSLRMDGFSKSDFWAPRRACDLGKVDACVLLIDRRTGYADAACRSVQEVCISGGPGQEKETACWLLNDRCESILQHDERTNK